MKKWACFNIPCTQSLSFRGWSLKQCRCHEHCGAVCRRATVSSALSLLASYTDMMCLTKAAGRSSNIQLPGNSKKKKKKEVEWFEVLPSQCTLPFSSSWPAIRASISGSVIFSPVDAQRSMSGICFPFHSLLHAKQTICVCF